jgi:hypothetical protein
MSMTGMRIGSEGVYSIDSICDDDVVSVIRRDGKDRDDNTVAPHK